MPNFLQLERNTFAKVAAISHRTWYFKKSCNTAVVIATQTSPYSIMIGKKLRTVCPARTSNQLSLIINKAKAQDYSRKTSNVLLETCRNRALDVFIRGLNGELSRILVIQRPKNLLEAYRSCLETQIINLRNYSI